MHTTYFDDTVFSYSNVSIAEEGITELVFPPLERLALNDAVNVRVGEDQGQRAQHHPELGVADLAILVPVHSVNHLVYLLVGHLPRHVHHNKPEPNTSLISNVCHSAHLISSAGIQPSESLLNTRNDSWKI